MTWLKYITLNGLLALFIACGGKTDASRVFSIQLEGDGKVYRVNETPKVSVSSKKDIPVEVLGYKIDGDDVSVEGDTLDFGNTALGNKTLVARINFEGETAEISRDIRLLAAESPTIYTYEILNEYPHDKGAFTQGLEFSGDTLYESTGKRGASSLRKVNYRTGEILQKTDLAPTYFGEGLTILNNKVYMLTWQSGTGFVYDKTTLEKTGSFRYGQSKEGWGLCNDGTKLYKSDGTEKIWLLDPETLVEQGNIQTVTDQSVFNKANELEYVNGKIYANVWQKESMMIIDSKTGAIEGVINFGGLKEKVGQHPQLDVLNGVAYHPERQTFFVTGKYWDKLFEIQIRERE